jgi:microcystin-dependent protein
MAEPFLGELKIVSFNFPPKGWAFCDGQLLPINQNQALFSILGTTYGGDGRVTFGLPNLQGRVPVHIGNGIDLGTVGGETTHTLILSELAAHNHTVMADSTKAGGTANSPDPAGTMVLGESSGSSGNPPKAMAANMYATVTSQLNTALDPRCSSPVGGNQPHQNMSPYLVLSVIIALQGIFPSQT